MFHSLQIKDYQVYYTEGFTRDKLNKLVNAGYLSVFMVNRTNNYTLSIKGLELMKKLKHSLNNNEETGIKGA
jgi:DNA-binding transcriptional regulator PaaX